MNFELSDAIAELLAEDKLDEAIVLAEEKLKQQESTDFDNLLNRTLLHQTALLVNFFSAFYERVKENLDVKAIYAEMNGFTINCDLWFLDLFAYDHVGGTDDTDWLADWEVENSTAERFSLTGYEDLQTIYLEYMVNEGYKDQKKEAASGVAELLIVLRLQELIRTVVMDARKKNLPWTKIPVWHRPTIIMTSFIK